MCCNRTPVTGITLPLLVGGSSLLLTIVSLGNIVSSSKYRNYDYRWGKHK